MSTAGSAGVGARRGLGRGLGSLIPTGPSVAPPTPAAPSMPSGPDRPGEADGPGAAFRSPPRDHGPARHRAEDAPTDDRQDPISPSANGARPAPAADARATVGGAWFAEIPVDRIRPNGRQPRQVFDPEELAELVHSIREVGLLQPVVVRPVDAGDFELVMGERRWRASREAGVEAIPAIVRATGDDDMLRDALLENLHRSQLNPLEEAAAYGQLLEDFGCTHDELAQRIGRSRPQISNTLRLMRLSPAVQRRVAAGVLSAGHARALLSVEDADLQDRLAQRVVAEGISVRGLEELVSVGEHGRAPRTVTRRPTAPGLVDIADRLQDRLETRVKVDMGKARGRITVDFATLEDLRRIVDIMDPRNRTDRVV